MAGDFLSEAEAREKGLIKGGMSKHFNSYTLRGRFNWVALTYGSLFGFVVLYKIKKWLSPPEPERPNSTKLGTNTKDKPGGGTARYGPAYNRDRDCGCKQW